jgi:hypothetical protein
MSGLAGHARSGQGSGNVSKAQKARGIEKAHGGKPWENGEEAEAETPMTDESAPVTEVTEAKALADVARSGNVDKMVMPPTGQPSVPSNIPGAGPQGVPPAEADEMGAFARRGNADLIPTVVNAQTGLASHGPKVAASVARMGGQVRLAPGQFGAWANPQDPSPKSSDQAASPAPAPRVY